MEEEEAPHDLTGIQKAQHWIKEHRTHIMIGLSGIGFVALAYGLTKQGGLNSIGETITAESETGSKVKETLIDGTPIKQGMVGTEITETVNPYLSHLPHGHKRGATNTANAFKAGFKDLPDDIKFNSGSQRVRHIVKAN